MAAGSMNTYLAIDPGIARAGYAVVESGEGRLRAVAYGCVETPAGLDPGARLVQVHEETRSLIQKFNPGEVVVEQLFFNTNVTTAMSVGEARGVILLAAALAGVPMAEYSPLEVKQAVVGYGRADKRQVQQMVKAILSLDEIPKPDDAADALALAICHVHSRTVMRATQGGGR